MEEEEKRRIFHEMMQKCFMKCDRFMIEKWKTTEKTISPVIEDEVRQNAYHNFMIKFQRQKSLHVQPFKNGLVFMDSRCRKENRLFIWHLSVGFL